MVSEIAQNFAPQLAIGLAFEARCRNFLGWDGFLTRDPPDRRWDFEMEGNGHWWRVECKIDVMAAKTRNLYFETSFKDNPSGIRKSAAHYWFHGLGPDGAALLFRTAVLKDFLDQHLEAGFIREVTNGGDDGASSGILMPLDLAYKVPHVREYF